MDVGIWVPVSDQEGGEIASDSLVELTDRIKAVSVKGHVADGVGHNILDSVDQVELIPAPKDDGDVPETTSKENIALWVSFERVHTMEFSVVSVPGEIDKFRLFVKGHGHQESVSVFEVPFLGASKEEYV